MNLDIEKMTKIAQNHFAPAATRAFGKAGTEALRATVRAIRILYNHVEPDRILGTLVVLHPLQGVRMPDYVVDDEAISGDIYHDCAKLSSAYDNDARTGTTVVEVLQSGDFRLFTRISMPDIVALSRLAIVYVYSERQEDFYIDGSRSAITNPSLGVHPSVFAIPTFRTLDDALEDYKERFIKTSRCPIFAEMWENKARLIFKNKPEAGMRRSLAHFLSVQLRNAEVHQEKIVDESHPVDMEVTWHFTKRVALIEIKWLGDSRTPTRNLTSYRDARANEGARQLAEYLDAKATQSPTHERNGYLVVIDGRRRGVGPNTTAVSYSDAMWYAEKEIIYEPPFHIQRVDFAEPIRMFAEPAEAACKHD